MTTQQRPPVIEFLLNYDRNAANRWSGNETMPENKNPTSQFAHENPFDVLHKSDPPSDDRRDFFVPPASNSVSSLSLESIPTDFMPVPVSNSINMPSMSNSKSTNVPVSNMTNVPELPNSTNVPAIPNSTNMPAIPNSTNKPPTAQIPLLDQIFPDSLTYKWYDHKGTIDLSEFQKTMKKPGDRLRPITHLVNSSGSIAKGISGIIAVTNDGDGDAVICYVIRDSIRLIGVLDGRRSVINMTKNETITALRAFGSYLVVELTASVIVYFIELSKYSLDQIDVELKVTIRGIKKENNDIVRTIIDATHIYITMGSKVYKFDIKQGAYKVQISPASLIFDVKELIMDISMYNSRVGTISNAFRVKIAGDPVIHFTAPSTYGPPSDIIFADNILVLGFNKGTIIDLFEITSLGIKRFKLRFKFSQSSSKNPFKVLRVESLIPTKNLYFTIASRETNSVWFLMIDSNGNSAVSCIDLSGDLELLSICSGVIADKNSCKIYIAHTKGFSSLEFSLPESVDVTNITDQPVPEFHNTPNDQNEPNVSNSSTSSRSIITVDPSSQLSKDVNDLNFRNLNIDDNTSQPGIENNNPIQEPNRLNELKSSEFELILHNALEEFGTKQSRSLEQSRRVQQIAQDSRYESILQIVSETLTHNTGKLLEATVRDQLQSSFSVNVAKHLAQSLKTHQNNFNAELKYEIKNIVCAKITESMDKYRKSIVSEILAELNDSNKQILSHLKSIDLALSKTKNNAAKYSKMNPSKVYPKNTEESMEITKLLDAENYSIALLKICESSHREEYLSLLLIYNPRVVINKVSSQATLLVTLHILSDNMENESNAALQWILTILDNLNPTDPSIQSRIPKVLSILTERTREYVYSLINSESDSELIMVDDLLLIIEKSAVLKNKLAQIG